MYSLQHVLQVRRSTIVYLTVAVMIAVFLVTCMYDVEERKKEDDIKVVAYCQRVIGNSIAFRVALHLFRSVYPSSPLYIHWDQDHALPVSGANLITYNKNKIEKTTNVGTGRMFFASVASMEAYIQRLKTAAGFQRNGWVLLLEDDVWVLSRIKQQHLGYDISGTCRGQLHTKCRECPTVIQAHSPNHRAFRNAECYGGCGGNYINSSRILALEGYQNLLEAILRAWGGPVPQDVLLSSVILADGGTIGDNPGYYEPGDLPPGFSNTKYGPPNIFHQMKWLYFMKYIVD
jgi:hypothetical protein